MASVWLHGNLSVLELSFMLVADGRTAQDKTGFIGENTFLSKLGQGEILKGVLKPHEIVAPERGLRISQWRKPDSGGESRSLALVCVAGGEGGRTKAGQGSRHLGEESFAR